MDRSSTIDDELPEVDLVALAQMMRSSQTGVWERTHGWLGCLRRDVICRVRGRIRCQRCADYLRERHGAAVYLKHWTEAWRIRCAVCGDILSQCGEEMFLHELGWYWYEPVIADADCGSARIAAAIDHWRVGDRRRGQGSGQPTRNTFPPLLSSLVVSIFRLDRTDPREPRALSRLQFAERLFVLAAVGARRLNDAEDAWRLLNVWLENRRVQRQVHCRRVVRRAGSSLKINVNLRLRPTQSQISIAESQPARPQSHN